MGLSNMNPYTNLARLAIENYIKFGKKILPPQNLPVNLTKERGGVFITIKKDGELRGCIGTILPQEKNIAQEIISNAISASSNDYRFLPLKTEELLYLSYEVNLLNEPEIIEKLEDLDPQKYGVIIRTRDGRCGLLLPHLEGIDTTQKQIEIAAQKGQIDLEKDQIVLYRFSTQLFTEND